MLTAAQVARMSAEQRRFYRLVDECGRNEDGSEDWILACGHWVHEENIPKPRPREACYLQCAVCMAEWLAQRRLHTATEQLLKLYLATANKNAAGVTVVEVLLWSERFLLILEGSLTAGDFEKMAPTDEMARREIDGR